MDGRPEDLLVVVVARAVIDAVVADAGNGVPVAEVEVEQIVGRANRVEQAEVVHLFVEIIHILSQQGAAAALKVLPGEQAARLLHQRDQVPLHQSPRRRGRDLGRLDLGHNICHHRLLPPVCEKG